MSGGVRDAQEKHHKEATATDRMWHVFLWSMSYPLLATSDLFFEETDRCGLCPQDNRRSQRLSPAIPPPEGEHRSMQTWPEPIMRKISHGITLHVEGDYRQHSDLIDDEAR